MSVQAFVDAYYEAYKWYLVNNTEGSRIMASAFGLGEEDFKAMISSTILLGPDESKRMLQPEGKIEKLFEKAAALWINSKVIEKLPANMERPVTSQFIR